MIRLLIHMTHLSLSVGLGQIQGGSNEHKEIQPWESIEMEHIDPFDDFEKYKAALQAEQKPLPNAVRFLNEKGGAA